MILVDEQNWILGFGLDYFFHGFRYFSIKCVICGLSRFVMGFLMRLARILIQICLNLSASNIIAGNIFKSERQMFTCNVWFDLVLKMSFAHSGNSNWNENMYVMSDFLFNNRLRFDRCSLSTLTFDLFIVTFWIILILNYGLNLMRFA